MNVLPLLLLLLLLLLRVSGLVSERASERWRESSEWMGVVASERASEIGQTMPSMAAVVEAEGSDDQER